jgi:myo-inositol-1(or 4)-monophosphatase
MNEILKTMEDAAREAGRIILSARGENLHVGNKSGRFNFVTVYDEKVQEFLFGYFRERYPEARFLGEEEGADQFVPGDEKGMLFVIDPIDGTTNFMHGMEPHVCSLSLFMDGEPYATVIYCPGLSQMFSAVRGGGAFENGRPMHTTDAPLRENVVIAGTSGFSVAASRLTSELCPEYALPCQGFRSLGSAEYNLCMVASGRVGAFFELRLNLWDYCAGALLVEEAGGKVVDWAGKRPDYRGASSIVALGKGLIDDPDVPDAAPYLEKWLESVRKEES